MTFVVEEFQRKEQWKDYLEKTIWNRLGYGLIYVLFGYASLFCDLFTVDPRNCCYESLVLANNLLDGAESKGGLIVL